MITACIGPLMWQVAVSMAATGCWGQPLLGEAVLDRVFAERESITSGVVHVYQVWDLGVGHRLIERDETAYFNNERCRFDIHWHSGFARLYESRGVPMPDPYAILIWDGQHILRAAGNLASTEYSLQSEDSSGLPLYSARHLGIPLVRAPEADLRRPHQR